MQWVQKLKMLRYLPQKKNWGPSYLQIFTKDVTKLEGPKKNLAAAFFDSFTKLPAVKKD